MELGHQPGTQARRLTSAPEQVHPSTSQRRHVSLWKASSRCTDSFIQNVLIGARTLFWRKKQLKISALRASILIRGNKVLSDTHTHRHIFGNWFACVYVCVCKLMGKSVILTPACGFSHSQKILVAFSVSSCSSPVRWWVSGASSARVIPTGVLESVLSQGLLLADVVRRIWSGGAQQTQVSWPSEGLRGRECHGGKVQSGSPEIRTAKQGLVEQQMGSGPRPYWRQRGGGVLGRYVRVSQDHLREWVVHLQCPFPCSSLPLSL